MIVETESSIAIETFDPYISIAWDQTNLDVFDGDFKRRTVPENFQGKWVFYQIGSTASMAYTSVTIRGAGQYFTSTMVPLPLTSTFRINLIQSCFPLTVMTR
jgi:hypothetical protein